MWRGSCNKQGAGCFLRCSAVKKQPALQYRQLNSNEYSVAHILMDYLHTAPIAALPSLNLIRHITR